MSVVLYSTVSCWHGTLRAANGNENQERVALQSKGLLVVHNVLRIALAVVKNRKDVIPLRGLVAADSIIAGGRSAQLWAATGDPAQGHPAQQHGMAVLKKSWAARLALVLDQMLQLLLVQLSVPSTLREVCAVSEGLGKVSACSPDRSS